MTIAAGDLAGPPASPAGHSPLRRAASVRRTSSIDICWPDGREKPMTLVGRARDVWSERADSEPIVLAQGEMEIVAASRRKVVSLNTRPAFPELQRLVGLTAMGASRELLAEIFEKQAGTPLYLLLDDYFGATLVASWAWSQWVEDWMARPKSLPGSGADARSSGADPRANGAGSRASMEGVCAGFRPGSSALRTAASRGIAGQSNAPVPSLPHPSDPDGWHKLPLQHGVGMRRARRIDVWIDAHIVHMDCAFQDSATTPAGGRVAVHEYRASATADLRDLELATLSVEPHILPYAECPAATPNAQRMLGTPLWQLRGDVPYALAGTLGCTHLNDVLRSLADVPLLAREIQKRRD